jgi:glycosyltransferase involved in cell wall biosynthesis
LLFGKIIKKRTEFHMIKVVEVISDTNIGGAGILLLSRLEQSERNRFKTTVILPKGSKLCERLNALKIDYIELDGCAEKSLEIFAIPKLYKEIRRLRPHILNSHACLSARVAGKLAKVPVLIQTRHSSFPLSKIYNYRSVRVFTNAVSRLLSDKIIAVAHIVERDLCKMGVDKDRIRVIINGARPLKRSSESEGMRLRESLNIPREATVVGICARLEKCKDHRTFLRAAAILSKSERDYRFLIVGEGSERQNLVSFARRLGIADKVIFTGFCANVSEYMSIFDINVNCSVGTETSSLALSEGMSLGIPAIASDYGGNPYMVKNSVNGFLYPQRNAAALAKRILLLEDKKLYHKLASGARNRFDRELNCARMTRLTENLYIELLKKRIDLKRSMRR